MPIIRNWLAAYRSSHSKALRCRQRFTAYSQESFEMLIYGHLRPTKWFSLYALPVILILAVAGMTKAQNGSTPLALTPGVPAGSYALSDIDTVNLYNGRVNIHIPLGGNSGRGGARSSAGLTWDAPVAWHVVTYYGDQGAGPYYYAEQDSAGVDAFTTNGVHTGGMYIHAKSAGQGANFCEVGGSGYNYYQYGTTITRLWYVDESGTEHEMRDRDSENQPKTVGNCWVNYGPSRGTVWVAVDGSGATYITDAPLHDGIVVGNEYPTVTSGSSEGGWLLLKDGRRYRFGSGAGLRDRNGNLITATKDSLNRDVMAEAFGTPSECTALGTGASAYCQKFVKKGFMGAQRVVWVAYDSSYRPLYIVLPNNLKYQFYYNSYDDLTRIDLPTGGSIEYTHEPGLSGTQPSYSYVQGGIPGTYGTSIYRRVTERRVYKEGHVLESRQTFSKPENVDSIDQYGGFQVSNLGYVDRKQYDAGETLLGFERHFFYGSAFSSLNVTGMASASWRDGREYRSETYNENSVSPVLLRVVEQLWEQRGAISWWTGGADASPQKDPRIAQVTTTLENGQTSRVSYGYDPYVPYNSLTDVYEYDFGSSGSPGPLLRHTQTSFLKNLNGIDYSASSIQIGTEVHLRDFPVQVSVFDSSKELSRTTYEYDNYGTDTNHAELMPRPYISGLDPIYGASYVTRGNVTAASSFQITNNVATLVATTYSQYDVAGNVVKMIDPRGFPTILDYADHFGTPNGEARANTAPAELTPSGQSAQSSYAFVTSVTNALGHTAYSQYDFYLGVTVDAEDATGLNGFEDGKGVITSVSFDDPLDRPSQAIRAVNRGAPFKNQVTFEYDDANRTVTSKSDLNTFNDNLLKSQSFYDGLGRSIESRSYENSTQYIAVKTVPLTILQNPETSGWVQATQTSNPFRPTLGEQPVWTTSFMDSLGRVTKVKTPDTAILSTYYDGARTLVVDPTEKKRLSLANALGELKDVWEIRSADSETEAVSFPNRSEVVAGYHTNYQYDALSNLTKVTQGTQAPREFVYDSLGRLQSAFNPENGTVNYIYDAGGNLLVKTDARGVSAHYSYDELSRPVRRWYNTSNSASATTHNNPALPSTLGVTDEVKYFYDSQTLPTGAPGFARGPSTGRMVATTYGGASSGDYFGYDAGGGVALKIQQTGGTDYLITTVHNASGRITSGIYPSQHTVAYSYDSAGRPSSFSGTLGDSTPRTYSTGAIYSPMGGLSQEQFGTTTPIYNKLFYNIRGQLSEIREGTTPNNTDWERGAIINFYSANCWGMCAGQAMSDNNGDLKQQEHWVQNSAGAVIAVNTQTFEYDQLNRIKKVSEGTAWKQEFIYDRYGNRRVDVDPEHTTPSLSPKAFEVQTSTNRLLAPGDTNLDEPYRQMRYDPAGNLTKDSYTGQGERTYDAENHLTSAVSTGSGSASYKYDGDGKRVRRNVDGVETWQVYGIGGELIAEYSASAPTASTPQKEYGYRNGQLLVTAGPAPPTAAAPSSLAAAPSSGGGNVVLSWSTASGATNYRVERKGATGSFTLAGTTSSTGLTDTGVSAGSAYLYRVCAANSQGTCTSPFSNIALGAAISFPTDPTIISSADDPTGVNVTVVKAAHITELRTAVNAVRTLAGLSAAQWTNQTLTATVSVISADDVRDLRIKLDEALTALGIQTSNYDDQTLSGAPNGTVIKKIHITQLRLRSTSGTGAAGGSSPNQFGVQWLVTDQLGTPRMVFDETGSLGNVKRHDYLPFGEDLAAGGRATTPGYGMADGVRQKFTGYEHDDETKLEFAQARYHSTVQGRFTSADPLLLSIDPSQPQSLNRYSYVINNPLNLTDPLGMMYFEGGGTAETNLQGDKAKDLPINILEIPADQFDVVEKTSIYEKYMSEGLAATKALRSMGGNSSLSDESDNRREISNETAMSNVLSVGSSASTFASYRIVSPMDGSWLGKNGIRYAAGHHPNGATGPLSLAKENAASLARLGKVLGIAGYCYSGFQTVRAYREGGARAAIKPGVDTLFGVIGTHGGPWGAGAGAIYFGVDMTYGWERLASEAAQMPRTDLSSGLTRGSSKF